MYLYIIRHAETEDNKNGIIQGHRPGILTTHWREQAKHLALYIASFGIDTVYTSDLLRAQETATIMMEEHDTIPIYTDPRLRERDTGSRTGRSFYELDPHGSPDTWSHLLDAQATVEPLTEVAMRARSCLHDREKKHADDVLAIVTDGWWMYALFQSMAINQPLKHISNTARCLCSRDAGKLRLLSPCATPHLPSDI